MRVKILTADKGAKTQRLRGICKYMQSDQRLFFWKTLCVDSCGIHIHMRTALARLRSHRLVLVFPVGK